MILFTEREDKTDKKFYGVWPKGLPGDVAMDKSNKDYNLLR